MQLRQTVAEISPKIDEEEEELDESLKSEVDKSMGIVTHITEALTMIKPTDPLRLVKREARKKRKCSDSSHLPIDSPRVI